MNNNPYRHAVGFREQRRERIEKLATSIAFASFLYVAFLAGQTVESLKPDPQKQWCMAANEQYETMRLAIGKTHGMILPVKQKGNRNRLESGK